ncbi:NeuD/PglB/VioB family sugar acetyltransferase [Flavobacterium saccharophilum]|uniref:Sugar O-acyltransferase, sialic acid O-acetyltransferase NeuD family n=1 Tax=Flavobacterium saccharophilum TaxID=29534 RepID=A0A1M7K9U4_9FLAO|nr:NeuD/PglB/VioB family sugar acetyltransferase [Flavobacterium saccharophilum]SHM61733.1 sugar O-acyltransferase, sialic acid O-acetyltransferase NeuD family [Flavobacterium saccharophilum]
MEDTQYNNSELIILGAGGLAREVASWFNISPNKKASIVGFMDNNLDALNGFETSLKILGQIDLTKIKDHQSVICAISDGTVKANLFKELNQRNISISNYIHESCYIGERTKYGIGLVLFPYAIISCDSTIGNFVFINNGSQIGHDVAIGNFSSIMANVDIGGGAQIGNNVFIGSNAVILPGVKIPDNTRIGAGSVVLKSLKTEGTYFGNPAKKIF